MSNYRPTADTPVSDREWVILANARRIAGGRFKKMKNGELAKEIFGLGSIYAWVLCRRVGVDPEGHDLSTAADAAARNALAKTKAPAAS